MQCNRVKTSCFPTRCCDFCGFLDLPRASAHFVTTDWIVAMVYVKKTATTTPTMQGFYTDTHRSTLKCWWSVGAVAVRVCVNHIKPSFLPVDIHSTAQCPCLCRYPKTGPFGQSRGSCGVFVNRFEYIRVLKWKKDQVQVFLVVALWTKPIDQYKIAAKTNKKKLLFALTESVTGYIRMRNACRVTVYDSTAI